jgi:hypothetical protein
MKRVIFITLFCFLMTLKGQSQPYFNKRFDIANKSNATISFKFYNDTFYIATQIAETPIPNLSYKSSLLKIDLLGNVVNQKRFKNANQYYTSSLDIIKFKNSYYQCGNTGAGNQIITSLLKFGENGDTIKTNVFGDTSYYFITTKLLHFTKTNNQLLMFGVTDSTCGSNHPGLYRPIIRVIDTNGVLIQSKTYLSGCQYRNITGVNTSEDKGFLIGFSTTAGTWGFESRLMKLDSNLNFVWDKKITETSSGYMGIVNSNDQNFHVATTIVDSVWNFTYKWERPSLTKLDLNGNILWQKYYGVKQQDIGVTGLKKCYNGDFIMSGARRVSGNELKGFIIRTDSLGNLKWWKEYRPNTTPLDTMADNYLYDIVELPNKDIAAVGWAGGTSLNPLQQTWLLKVDSNGCFGASNCPPNVITVIKENNSNSVELTPYPNPFKDELNINYSILDFEGVAELQLIELASGRLIDNIELTQSIGTKQFNTQNLANGLYVLSLKQNNKPSVNLKVINIK